MSFPCRRLDLALPGLAWLGLAWFDLVWLGGARLDADASCLREIHLAPEPPFQAPPRHIPGPGGTKLCSPAPILRANCLIINNGRCQVNFTKRCMRVHSGYACVADVLPSCRRLHHSGVYIKQSLSSCRRLHHAGAYNHTVASIVQSLTVYGGDRCCRLVKTDIISGSIVTFCENRRRSVSGLRMQPQGK